MADTMKNVIWFHKGRPCVVTAQERVSKPKVGGRNFGSYDRLTVEYLDGQQPRLGHFGLQAWGGQARKMRGAKALVWARVRDLVDGGMKTDRAIVQATAEAAKGILSHPGAGPAESPAF